MHSSKAEQFQAAIKASRLKQQNNPFSNSICPTKERTGSHSYNTAYLSEKDKHVFYLICRQYPNSCNIVSDKIHIKPSEDIALREKITTYLSELYSKSEEEINDMYTNAYQQEKIELERQHEERERLREPSYFFNQPGSNATEEELEYRAKMSYWTIEEALTLLFGKDPAVVKWDKIKDYKDKSPFAKEYSKVRELILRAISANELKGRKDLVGLSPTTVRPADVLTWAKKKGIQVNCTLEKIVLEQNKEATDYEALYQAKCRENEELKSRLKDLEKNPPKKTPSAQTIELETKNKMIAVMARKKYQYRASASKSPATKNIHNDSLECGLSLSEDTILKHLREASELLPQNPEESIY